MRPIIEAGAAGINIRMNKIFNKNKLFMVPIDHAVNSGPIQGLSVRHVVQQAVECGVDAVMLRPGMVKNICDIPLKNTSIILSLTGKFDRGVDHRQINSVEYALKCGASAVCAEFKLGSDGDLGNACIASQIVETAHDYGVPVLITVYVLQQQLERVGESAYVHACMIAEELGADIIKTALPENDVVIRHCLEKVSIPIIIAGGDLIEEELLKKRVKQNLDLGISGIAFGRNIWGRPDAKTIMKTLTHIVHSYS